MKYKILVILMLIVVLVTACGNVSKTEDTKADSAKADEAKVEVKKDGSIHAEDEKTEVDIKITDEGVKTEIKTEEIPEVKEADKVAITEWCVKGQKYEFSAEGGASSTIIQGVETYKGKEFCKGVSKTKAGPMEVVTTYYFTQGGEEMWVIADVAGQKTETHITN